MQGWHVGRLGLVLGFLIRRGDKTDDIQLTLGSIISSRSSGHTEECGAEAYSSRELSAMSPSKKGTGLVYSRTRESFTPGVSRSNEAWFMSVLAGGLRTLTQKSGRSAAKQ